MSNIPADLRYAKSHEWLKVAADGTALVHYWIGNGFDETEAISTYTALPEVLDLSNSDLPEALTDPVVGATVGSRIVTSLEAEEIFGPVGQPAYGISNKDPLLLVTDVLGPYPVDAPYEEEGTGFGIAIARDVAEAAGAQLDFGRSEMGGLRADLRWPSG